MKWEKTGHMSKQLKTRLVGPNNFYFVTNMKIIRQTTL